MGKKKSGRNSKAAAAAPKETETATATAFVLKVPTHCRCDGCGDKIRSAVKDLTLRCEGILSLDQSALATKGELAVVATADPERLRRRLRKATGKDVGLVFPKPPAKSAAAAVADAAKEAAAAAATVQELLARMHLQQQQLQQQQPVLHAHPVPPAPQAPGTRSSTAGTRSRRTPGCCRRRCPRSRTSRPTLLHPGARTRTSTTALVAPTAAADSSGSDGSAWAEEPVPEQDGGEQSRSLQVMELLASLGSSTTSAKYIV